MILQSKLEKNEKQNEKNEKKKNKPFLLFFYNPKV